MSSSLTLNASASLTMSESRATTSPPFDVADARMLRTDHVAEALLGQVLALAQGADVFAQLSRKLLHERILVRHAFHFALRAHAV